MGIVFRNIVFRNIVFGGILLKLAQAPHQGWIDRRWLILLFLMVNLITGWRLATTTPMGQVADEPSHVARAASLLHGQIFASKRIYQGTPVGGLKVDPGIAFASMEGLGQNMIPMTPGKRAGVAKIPWTHHNEFDLAIGAVPYFPALYAPGALGIETGKILGLGPLHALYLGRVFLLAAYLALGCACLWFARAGRGVFFTLLSLPMALSLGASFNLDGMIIACCALAGALFTLDPAQYPKARWIAAALIALVICDKPPYALMLFAAALPIAARGALRRLIMAGLFAVPSLIWIAAVMHSGLMSVWLPPYHPGPLWPGDPNAVFTGPSISAGLKVLLHAPRLIFTLPYNYFHTYGSGIWDQFIGILGWLNVLLPSRQYTWWSVAIVTCLAGALFTPDNKSRRWQGLDALFVALLITASMQAICLALYLSWTKVGMPLISGVQGRYLLPLVALLPLILPRYRCSPRVAAIIEIASILPVALLALHDKDLLPKLIHAKFGW
jgi:uncharacterized membrane protein